VSWVLKLFGGFSLKTWLYGLGATLLAVAVAVIRQSGADHEKLKQAQADVKAATTIGKARADARSSSDAELDKKVDKWTRP
jgi:hypothetical protein